jgi:2-amino-4-hydroxy-6-hydroxymethyldihydropteridine diphosphokinase
MAVFSYLVAVGSNLGERRQVVKQALEMIESRGLRVEAVSELVETAPIGAADKIFLNGAFICSGDIAPDDLMRLLLDIEEKLGRVRDVRWGNRLIDLDVLLIRNDKGESIENQSPVLSVPHPRMLERDFMLRPAAAVAGHWVLPFSDQNLRALCVSRGWRPAWNNLKGDIKLWQALKADVFSATTSRWWWPVLMLMLMVRLWFAARVPFGNDEAYYWDWGRNPQASYFDHPPFVSWLAMFSRLLVFSWTEGPLQGRFLIPFMHLATTFMFGALVVRLTRRVLTNLESRAVLIISQLVPAFSLGGIMLMPDVGLIFFSTTAVWLVLAISRREHLAWWNGVLVGLALGFAGLSKYHAAIIASGLLGWLFWRRQENFWTELGFWIWLIFCGLLTVSPVIWWNASHEWVSIKFQAGRGVSGDGIDAVRALRTLLGEALFLGPTVLVGLWLAWLHRQRIENSARGAILWSALPLLVLLKLFSFTSQTLPHWSVPAFWLLAVFAVSTIAESRTLRWIGRIYGILLCVVVPLILSMAPSRRALLRWTGDRPAALGEMTLWPQAVKDKDLMHYVTDQNWTESSLSARKLTDRRCERGLVMAAPRWFTVAQVAANFPGHPVVENLDLDHLSYYHFRPRTSVAGCPVLVVSEKSHWRTDGWGEWLEIFDSKEFVVDGHRDRPVVIGRGWFNVSSVDQDVEINLQRSKNESSDKIQ